jgi:hypothetical protein
LWLDVIMLVSHLYDFKTTRPVTQRYQTGYTLYIEYTLSVTSKKILLLNSSPWQRRWTMTLNYTFGACDYIRLPSRYSCLALYTKPVNILRKLSLLFTNHIHLLTKGRLNVFKLETTVPTYKYLGVIFDSQLRWAAHHHKVTASGPSRLPAYLESQVACPHDVYASFTTPSPSPPLPTLRISGLLIFTDRMAAPNHADP